jgi:hypothetical protein
MLFRLIIALIVPHIIYSITVKVGLSGDQNTMPEEVAVLQLAAQDFVEEGLLDDDLQIEYVL